MFRTRVLPIQPTSHSGSHWSYRSCFHFIWNVVNAWNRTVAQSLLCTSVSSRFSSSLTSAAFLFPEDCFVECLSSIYIFQSLLTRGYNICSPDNLSSTFNQISELMQIVTTFDWCILFISRVFFISFWYSSCFVLSIYGGIGIRYDRLRFICLSRFRFPWVCIYFSVFSVRHIFRQFH